MTPSQAGIAARWFGILKPPPKLTVSQWAEREMRLSPEASAEPGQVRFTRAAYQRGILDAISDPDVHTVVVMSSAQVGKTTLILAMAGYHIDQDPSPMLLLQPTIEMAEAFSKDRLAPMLRDTPALASRVKDPRSRDSGNTLLQKVFPGGHITMAGANSPASLASRPIRAVMMDEVDRYPASAGTEGDPVTLARKRTTTFWNRKIVLTSTPTKKGESRIEAAFGESDRRRFHVPCPHCGEVQPLRWANVRWPEGEPAQARYQCDGCGVLWSDAERWSAVRRGHWVAERECAGVAGFHLSELYSPWVRLAETVQNFIDAQGNPERLRAWVNTSLGETWEDRGETVDPTGLKSLCEVYGPDELPEGVLLCTAGVDVQNDRLEVEVVGWGASEESAGVEYRVLYGDPAQPSVWADLDALLLTEYRTASGRPVRIVSAAVDSGGHFTEAVYRFTRERFRRRVYAIKGMGGPRPVWPKTATKVQSGHVFIVGVDTAKETVYARWRLRDPGPGYCHLPADPSLGYDDQWFDGATSETRQTRYREGRPYTVWVLPKGKRNEPLDCRVYALAALKSLPRTLLEGKRREVEAVSPEPVPVAPVRARRVETAPASDDWLNTGSDWL